MDWCDIEEPEKEREILLRAIRKNRSDAQLYYRLATVYENVKDFEKAILYGLKACRLQPDNVDFVEFMDYVYTRSCNIPEAIRYFEERVKTDEAWHGQLAINLKLAREYLPFWLEQHPDEKENNKNEENKNECHRKAD